MQFVLNTEKALDEITSSILLNRFWVHKFLDFQASSRCDICPTYWRRQKMYTWTCTQNPIIDIELMVWALPLLILMKKLKPFQDMIFVKLICVTRKFELENFQQNALIPTIRTCKQCSKIRKRWRVMPNINSILFSLSCLGFFCRPPFPQAGPHVFFIMRNNRLPCLFWPNAGVRIHLWCWKHLIKKASMR